MIGLALEGGADRCAFTAGVVDVLMRHQFYASAASGTSAGAGCVLNYRSKQPGLFRQMMLMQNEKPYFGICHMLRTGRFLNLNEMASQYAEQLNFPDYFRFSMQTDCVATCCENGESAYLTGNNKKVEILQALQASCALPMICAPVEIDGRHYVDGSIADPIPFQHLLEQGCQKVIVVLTGHDGCQPTDYRKFRPLLSVAYRKRYPALHHALLHRIARYQEQIVRMQQAQKTGGSVCDSARGSFHSAVHQRYAKNRSILPARVRTDRTHLASAGNMAVCRKYAKKLFFFSFLIEVFDIFLYFGFIF